MRTAQISKRRRRSSGGNALLESTFTLVPLMALILAFFNFGFAIYKWTTLQNAVREGCRYAITFQTMSGLGQDASIGAIVKEFGMGMVDPTLTGSSQQVFINYYSPTNTNRTTGPINPGGNVPGNLVEVSISLNMASGWIAPLSGKYNDTSGGYQSFILNVYSSDVLGGYPYGVASVSR
jgi:Flp pilus assembly protein TadG